MCGLLGCHPLQRHRDVLFGQYSLRGSSQQSHRPWQSSPRMRLTIVKEQRSDIKCDNFHTLPLLVLQAVQLWTGPLSGCTSRLSGVSAIRCLVSPLVSLPMPQTRTDGTALGVSRSRTHDNVRGYHSWCSREAIPPCTRSVGILAVLCETDQSYWQLDVSVALTKVLHTEQHSHHTLIPCSVSDRHRHGCTLQA